jgi:Tol biopolymer transport system component
MQYMRRRTMDNQGYLLWMQGTTLLGQVFDARRAKLSGDPIPVAEGVGFADGWHFVDLSASNSGVLLYGAGNTALSRLTWLRRDGSLLEKVSDPDWFRSLRLSPGGRRAVIERGIGRTLWMMNFERNVLTRTTFEPGLSGWAAWAPDGRQIAYSAERGGTLSLFRRDSSGATPEERLTTSPFADYMYDWSRDGRYMIYCEVNPQTKLDLWVLPFTGDRKTVSTAHDAVQRRLSPVLSGCALGRLRLGRIREKRSVRR